MSEDYILQEKDLGEDNSTLMSAIYLLQDELLCEICANLYNLSNRRPKNLNCGHTFCCECMAKEITNGRRTCPTCCNPHNARSVAQLPMNVTLERLIRKMTETLSGAAKSCDSEDEEEDDYSGGPCSTHKKSVLYFYCQTHSVQICRECTVIDHPTSTCKLISFKEENERQKDDDISKTSSTVTDINDTLSAMWEIFEKKKKIISDKVNEIQQWKKAISKATKAIDAEKIAIEKINNQIATGMVKRKDLEAAKRNLQNAKKKKTITNVSKDIETVTKNATNWIQDVNKEFEISLFVENSPAPANILKGLKNSKVICAETAVDGKKATAKLEAKDDKLHLHPFKFDSSHEGAITVKYDAVLSHLPQQPPTLLFLDLTHNQTYKGRVYIRLEPELHAFIKHIHAIVTGENGNSVLGNSCWDAYSYHFGILIKRTVNDISLRKMNAVTVQSGAVVCDFRGENIDWMFLYLDNEYTYNSRYAKIGHVVSGLDVAKACKALGDGQQTSITISDCGLVLEM